mmetsp:Transcript_18162/g.28445  ORF Transcript_18162/g.28445 Transcript_18162/m.28445 type:complete len:382 (-) Transcript_18162:135-1280(-)
MNIDHTWERIVQRRVSIPDSILSDWGHAAVQYILPRLDVSDTCMGRIKSIQATLSRKLMRLLVDHNAQMYCFGSPMVNGVVEKNSDIDFVYLSKDDVRKPLSVGDICTPQSRAEQTSILSAMAKILMKDSDVFISVQEKPRARVPYVRALLKNGTEIDISANRRNGVRNSLLLRSYFSQKPYSLCQAHERSTSLFRMLSLALKLWGKRSSIVDPSQAFLTSYAFNVMICFYLQQRGRMSFIDPSSIAIPIDRPTMPDYRELTFAHEDDFNFSLRLGELMRDLLAFYNHEFDYNSHVVSISRQGLTTKDFLRWSRRDEEKERLTDGTAFYRFCVEDPYEDRLNLGRFVTPLRYSMFRMALHQAQLNGFGYLDLKRRGARVME